MEGIRLPAAGLAVMEIFEEENLLQTAEALGKKLKKRFDTFQKNTNLLGTFANGSHAGVGVGQRPGDQGTRDHEAKALANLL